MVAAFRGIRLPLPARRHVVSIRRPALQPQLRVVEVQQRRAQSDRQTAARALLALQRQRRVDTARSRVFRWRSGYGVGLATGDRGFDSSRCTVECDLGKVVCTHVPLSPSSMIWYQRKLGSKQAHRATHWPRVHGLAASVGVRLRANESKISAVPWAKWLGKDFDSL